MTPDTVNAAFEFIGAYFVWLSIKQLYRDKLVRGFNWKTTAFWTLWGGWNIYYYPHLDQTLSFLGGLFVFGANLIYLGMIVYYMRRERTMLVRRFVSN